MPNSRITEYVKKRCSEIAEERKYGPFSKQYEQIIDEKFKLADRVEKACKISNFEINLLIDRIIEKRQQ